MLLCFAILVIAGCASKTNIEANLNDGKSVVILPDYDTNGLRIYWAKAGSNATYDFSFNYGTSRLGIYFALPVETGVYYIKSISLKSTSGFNPIYTEEYNSIFGNIILEKTPEEVIRTVVDNTKKNLFQKRL
ncbi:MAG: YgdI/YgdR family lipoprotein [Campylobacteraceae bacterium]|nr:YgdI/YgdR family lipoprotein [Campylobacteraceae bacterium]